MQIIYDGCSIKLRRSQNLTETTLHAAQLLHLIITTFQHNPQAHGIYDSICKLYWLTNPIVFCKRTVDSLLSQPHELIIQHLKTCESTTQIHSQLCKTKDFLKLHAKSKQSKLKYRTYEHDLYT